MAERTIVGVDFSGRESDTHTWATKALLDTEEQSVILLSCKPTPRDELTALLGGLPDDGVAALDFPFSVPVAFSGFLGCRDAEMPALWKAAARMGRQTFINKRDDFVIQNQEYLRAGDLHVPGCYSCLHAANPNMVPMTFHGMEMLNTLWDQTNCQVPPLDVPARTGAILLEAMPGAALRAFGLPDKGYKGGQKAFENRQKILKRLPRSSEINVINLPDFRDELMFSDDALDSIVATIVAALWSVDEEQIRFVRPSDEQIFEPGGKRQISPDLTGQTQLEAAKKEGWIYVPVASRQ